MNDILKNYSIFEISNMVFVTIILFIVLVLLLKQFGENKIFKALNIFILITVALGVYALVWLTFFKDILTMKDVDFLFILLYGAPIVLFLAFTNIPIEIDMHFGNDGSRTPRNNSMYHDRDYDSNITDCDTHIKHHKKENEKEREAHYYSDNNASYSSNNFDFDDD